MHFVECGVYRCTRVDSTTLCVVLVWVGLRRVILQCSTSAAWTLARLLLNQLIDLMIYRLMLMPTSAHKITVIAQELSCRRVVRVT